MRIEVFKRFNLPILLLFAILLGISNASWIKPSCYNAWINITSVNFTTHYGGKTFQAGFVAIPINATSGGFVEIYGYLNGNFVGVIPYFALANNYYLANKTTNGNNWNFATIFFNPTQPIPKNCSIVSTPNFNETNFLLNVSDTNIANSWLAFAKLNNSYSTNVNVKNYITNYSTGSGYFEASFNIHAPYLLFAQSNFEYNLSFVPSNYGSIYDRLYVTPSKTTLQNVGTFTTQSLTATPSNYSLILFPNKFIGQTFGSYVNGSIYNTSNTLSHLNGIFYQNTQYVLKIPYSYNAPSEYLIFPAYSTNVIYSNTLGNTNTITITNSSTSLPTFMYYFNITNINWTMPAQDYYQNAQYYQNPSSYNATILLLTLPHYSQLDTDSQACGNIQVKAYNSQNTFLGYVNVNLLNYNTSICNYVIANQTLNTKTAYAKLQVLFGANPNIASQLNSSYKPFVIYNGSNKAGANSYSVNGGVLLLKHFVYTNDSFTFAGDYYCGASYPCAAQMTYAMTPNGAELMWNNGATQTHSIIPQTYPSLITFSKPPYVAGTFYTQSTISGYVWGYFNGNSNFYLVNETSNVGYGFTSNYYGAQYNDVLYLSQNSSAIWLPYYTIRYILSAPQSISSSSSSNATQPVLPINVSSQSGIKSIKSNLNQSAYVNANGLIISSVNFTSISKPIMLLGIFSVPLYMVGLIDIVVMIFSAMLIKSKKDIAVLGILYIALGFTTLTFTNISLGIIAIIFLYALMHLEEGKEEE